MPDWLSASESFSNSNRIPSNCIVCSNEDTSLMHWIHCSTTLRVFIWCGAPESFLCHWRSKYCSQSTAVTAVAHTSNNKFEIFFWNVIKKRIISDLVLRFIPLHTVCDGPLNHHSLPLSLSSSPRCAVVSFFFFSSFRFHGFCQFCITFFSSLLWFVCSTFVSFIRILPSYRCAVSHLCLCHIAMNRRQMWQNWNVQNWYSFIYIYFSSIISEDWFFTIQRLRVALHSSSSTANTMPYWYSVREIENVCCKKK